jgi:RNA recognition motif-containing protein
LSETEVVAQFQVDRFSMNNRLFVGNLDYNTMEHQLREAFAQFGEVNSATVVVDRVTGRSRGFGFVEFGSASEAQRAIESLDGSTLGGRAINVNVARERTNGGGGGGRGFGAEGGGGDFGGNGKSDRGRRDRW